MNYRCIWDGEMSCIEKTTREADGWEVFTTLKSAKRALVKDLQSLKRGLSVAIRQIQALTDAGCT